MRRWFKRLFGGAVTPAPGPARLPTALRDELPVSAAAAPGFGARRPLLSAGGEIAGFEFELGLSSRDGTRAASDPMAQAAQAIALLNSMRSTVESGRVALARLPAVVLARPAVAAQAARGTMLAIDADAQAWAALVADTGLIAGLRARGVQVGGSAAWVADLAAFDFITLALPPEGLDALLETARQCRAAHPGVTLVATGLDSIDDLERALQGGVTFVAGQVDAMRAHHGKRPQHTGVQRICQMLNRVVTDQDTALIANDISVDVALSYRMLRYVNSPALGLSRAVESVEQAVMLLGRDELYRWLSVLLLSSTDGRKSSRALQEISLARARLLETLARERGIDPPDALFTVGLLSLLDVLLQEPLADALRPLNLGDAARQALLERRGAWHDYLALACALERHDLVMAASHAEKFGGLDAVLAHAEQAWRWAALAQGTLREGPG